MSDRKRGHDVAASAFLRCVLPAMALGLFALLVTQPAAQARQCSEQNFEGAGYVVCAIDPEAEDLRIFWKDADDKPYRRFSKLAEAVGGEGRELVFAINAGMYQTDFSPIGLHIENGEELQPADTVTIDGPPRQVPNFYKKPNGVFFLDETGAGILPTEAFLDLRPDVRFATQSGPCW